jgi:hypothetical protein
MFKTTYRDLAATVCGTLGMLTIAVSLILTPLPAWGGEPGGPEPSLCPLGCHRCGNPVRSNPDNPARPIICKNVDGTTGTCAPSGVPNCESSCLACEPVVIISQQQMTVFCPCRPK